LNLEFTLIFTTNFVGSLDIRASREVFPIEVRNPEIGQSIFAKKRVGVHALARHVMALSDVQLYQLSSIRHFVTQIGLLVISRDI
jgi:hypothetical protein